MNRREQFRYGRILGVVAAAVYAILPASVAASQAEQIEYEPGISMRVYELEDWINQLRPLVAGQTPNRSWITPNVDFDDARGDWRPQQERFLVLADGWIKIETPGRYEFELTSDDGSVFFLDGKKVIDNDMEHGTKSVRAAIELEAGLHPVDLRFFQGVGQAVLQLSWRPPGAKDFAIVPAGVLLARKGEVRVTSPGPKKVITPLRRGRPGDGQPLTGVHPSFDHAVVHPAGFTARVGGIDFLPDGRMVLCAWEPKGEVYLMSGVTGSDPEAVSVKRFAVGLAEPLGVMVVGGRIFVLQKQELTELIDHDGDDVADEYRCVCSGWQVTGNFHEFAFGLARKDGAFFATLATAINPGGRSTWPQVGDRGTVVTIKDDGSWQIVARGLRTPNGIGVGVDGELYVTDNQGDWLPSSKLVHVKEGAFYGSQSVIGESAKDLPVSLPVVWLPQGEIGNSPGEVVPIDEGPYRGQMLHSDVTHGGVKRVFAEKVNGEYQGCVFRFTQGLEAGINRIRWGPGAAGAGSRSLYLGGIGSTGDWGQEGKARHGLERLTFNGASTFEMLAIRTFTNGMEIEFTEPLGEDVGVEPGNYYVERYHYVPTVEYGGPKVDQRALTIRSVTLDSQRTHAFLEIPDLANAIAPGYGAVIYFRLVGDWHSATARHQGSPNSIWSTESWYTLNALPSRMHEVNPAKPMNEPNTLTAAEKADGWRLLFDGRSTAGWRGFNSNIMPSGWTVENGALVRGSGGGDLVTDEEFENFELSLDWKIERGGNSGIFFHVLEKQTDGRPFGAVWETGPEMQILDNEHHPDGQNPLTSAGADYGLHAPTFDASYPPGVWNRAMISVRNDRVTFMLNGQKQCEFVLGSAQWNDLVAKSKFAGMTMYGKSGKGRIALQDHGDHVEFRNIKIRAWPRMPTGD